jgi:hypothetical protein
MRAANIGELHRGLLHSRSNRLESGFGAMPLANGTVQGAVATWRFVGAEFRGRQVATAPCTVPFSEFASGISNRCAPNASHVQNFLILIKIKMAKVTFAKALKPRKR